MLIATMNLYPFVVRCIRRLVRVSQSPEPRTATAAPASARRIPAYMARCRGGRSVSRTEEGWARPGIGSVDASTAGRKNLRDSGQEGGPHVVEDLWLVL